MKAKLKMYESEVKTAVLKITKVTKDSQSLSNVFIFGLAYIKLSKTFERFLKIRKSFSFSFSFSLVGHFKQGDHIFDKLNSLRFPGYFKLFL